MRGRSREEECRARVSAAAGREFSPEELEELMERVQARTNRYRATGETPEAAALRAGLDEAADARRDALVAQRQRYINVMARQGLEARKIPGDEFNSLAAAQGGSTRGGREFGYSAQAVGKEKHESLIRNLEADLTRADLLPVLKRRDPQFDRELTNELWYLEDSDAPRPRSADPQVRQTAEILHKHQEILRKLLNQAGAWIGKLDHYVTRQSHDMWKIRAETFQAWRDFILPRLDRDRTFGHLVDPAKQEEFLRDVWNSVRSGYHEEGHQADWLGGFSGPANLAKRLSQERVLHFKDGDGFFEYNQRFGQGSIIGSIIESIERGSMNYGRMRVFGTNSKAMITAVRDQWAAEAKRRGTAAGDKIVARLRSKSFDNLTGMLTGEANTPEGKNLAQWGQTLRQWKNMTSLGWAMVSSLPDLGSAASLLQANGMPYFQAMFHQLAALLPTTSEARRLALLEMYGSTKSTMADTMARYRAEDSKAGHLTSASNLEFKLNGQNWWNRAMRNGTGSGLGALWAEHLKAPFEKLPWEAHNILKRYGLDDEGSWRALQRVETRDVDGDHFFFPGEILNLPDEAVAHLGPNPDSVRENLKSRVGALFSDQIGEALSDPTLRQRATLSWGAPGSLLGEASRSVFQFKTFAMTFLTRSVGRTVLRGDTPMFGGRLNVDLPGLTSLMVGTTVLGGLSIMIKDLLTGSNPMDRLNKPGNFFLEAVTKGGGLGIYGDVLLGKNQFGYGIPQILAGPVLGNIDEITTIFKNFYHGEFKKVSAETGRLISHSVPYANLFYFDLAMRHFFMYGLQEVMNPGYLRRVEQKARQQKQSYWLRPSQAVQF
jgi:hypothetical protein